MAKKKKKKKVETPPEPKPTEGQYYWCVNCGRHGDYGYIRKRNLKCEDCDYDDISIWTKEEIIETDIENMPLDKFVKKGKTWQPLPEDHVEMRKTVADSKKILKELDDKYPKQTIADKLAKIKKL